MYISTTTDVVLYILHSEIESGISFCIRFPLAQPRYKIRETRRWIFTKTCEVAFPTGLCPNRLEGTTESTNHRPLTLFKMFKK